MCVCVCENVRERKKEVFKQEGVSERVMICQKEREREKEVEEEKRGEGGVLVLHCV